MENTSPLKEYQKVREMLTEQVIKKTISVTAGSTGVAEIQIPKGKLVYLKGYGYTYHESTTYLLATGIVNFPARTDQEGSVAQPRIFEVPFKANQSGRITLSITNAAATDADYEVMFIVMTQSLLTDTSSGGEIIVTTGAGAGSLLQCVIYNAAGTETAEVVTRGDGTKALAVDTELVIDNATLKIDNLFTASTNGLSTGAGYMLIDAAGNLQVDVVSNISAVSDSVEVLQSVAADLNCTEASAASILADTTAILADTAAIEISNAAILVDTGVIAGDTTSIDSKITACNTGAVVVSSGAITETNSAAILADTTAIDTQTATIAGDTTSIDAKITACNTGAVVVASGAITETNSAAILADTAAIDTATAALVAVESALTTAHTAPTIGSASTTALASAAGRVSALFQNIADEVIWLNIGGTAAASTGIKLLPEASYSMSAKEGTLSTAAVTAICATGGKKLLVTQFT